MLLILGIFMLYLVCIIVTNIFFEDTNLISIFISIIFLLLCSILFLYNIFKSQRREYNKQ